MNCRYSVEIGSVNKILDEKTERLVGEVLTILEAVIPGDRQMEAAKATIKRILWNTNRDVKLSLELVTTIKEEN